MGWWPLKYLSLLQVRKKMVKSTGNRSVPFSVAVATPLLLLVVGSNLSVCVLLILNYASEVV